MWNIDGEPTAVEYFAELNPEHVLYEFDGPRIFTSRDAFGRCLLCHLCDEDEARSRILVVPCNDRQVAELEQARTPVRSLLCQTPHVWVVDVLHEGTIERAWLAMHATLPEEALPRVGVLLRPSSSALVDTSLRRTGTKRRTLPSLGIPPQDMSLFARAS